MYKSYFNHKLGKKILYRRPIVIVGEDFTGGKQHDWNSRNNEMRFVDESTSDNFYQTFITDKVERLKFMHRLHETTTLATLILRAIIRRKHNLTMNEVARYNPLDKPESSVLAPSIRLYDEFVRRFVRR